MLSEASSPPSDDSEEARAFLQSRVALFWKVLFFIALLSIGLGMVGAIAEPGMDFVIDLASTAQAGIFWMLCRRGKRSVRFSRAMEAGGLLIQLTFAAFMGRFLLFQFSSAQAFMSPEAANMADGFVSMMLAGGLSMLVAIRAALIPSSPRRTVLVTATSGVPIIVVPAIFVTGADGELAWRALDSAGAYWLSATSALMWGFAIIMCTVISWVIYGLRAEVKEARQLGQYVLEAKIGEGGMGEVYRAHHGMMKRPTAVKLLKAERAGEDSIRRFEREVQLTARLSHPNTITIFDYGRTGDGVFYYAMELLDGATLQRIVAVTGAQPVARAVGILSMACGALSEAHSIGLIHRDIKPANIMLCARGGELDVVKVLDFGLVKQLEVDEDVTLTAANSVTGTPQYMAPESVREPESVDARTDIYALGAVAYYLLAGVDVFEGKSVVEILSKHLYEEPEPLSARGIEIPSDLEAVVFACLEKNPDRRPQSAAELRRRIEACGVEPWDNTRARAWWREHEPDLAGDEQESIDEAKTITVGPLQRQH